MPSWVMLPFIQCHHTRGLAPLGGSSNPLRRGSAECWAIAAPHPRTSNVATPHDSFCHRPNCLALLVSLIVQSPATYQPGQRRGEYHAEISSRKEFVLRRNLLEGGPSFIGCGKNRSTKGMALAVPRKPQR